MYDEFDALVTDTAEVEQASEHDLWFLLGPMEEEPDYLPPGPKAEPREIVVVDDWRRAGAGSAARLAPVAGGGSARWTTGCAAARKAGGTGSR